MPNTLLLDHAAWDLVLDASGNIVVAGEPYAIAQDVASAIRTCIGECWYGINQGLPYFQRILGQLPPPSFLRQKITVAALAVPNVVSVEVVFVSLENRALTGQIKIIDSTGTESGVTF